MRAPHQFVRITPAMATPRSSHHLSAAAAAGVSYPPPLPPTPPSAPPDMGAGGAAKQIVDSLLARFLPLARRRIETAQAQVSRPLSYSAIIAFISHHLMAWIPDRLALLPTIVAV